MSVPEQALRERAWPLWAGLLCVLATTLIVYWPGLTGTFILDDSNNLAPLGDNGGIRDLDSFLSFVFSGKAGPLGRPLSLATFALNAQQWPADPWAFKITNVVIHLLNTVLVFVLALVLLKRVGSAKPTLAALLCSAIWALHPFQVSTVLYVVQRMTELCALFTLLGLIAFVYGRDLAVRKPLTGYAWILGGIGGGGLLAIFCKESGVLLPLYAVTLEMTVLRHQGAAEPPRWRVFSLALLALPAAAFAAYPVIKLPEFIRTYSVLREFTLEERLMTQGRVLVDYLWQLLVPKLSGTGVFHDDFRVSRSLIRPPDALLAWLLIGALLAIAFIKRRSQSILSLGLLWFFAGHSLEASFIPLELYFEHRNYLPAMGLALIAAHYVTVGARRSQLPYVGVALFLILESGITWTQARVWGDEPMAAEVWSREHPDSLRAQLYASNYWNSQGDFSRGLSYFERATDLHAMSATARLHVLELRCRAGLDLRAYARSSLQVLQTGPFDFGGPDSLSRIQRLVAGGACPGLDKQTLMQVIDAYASNPAVKAQASQSGYLAFIKASALAAEARYQEAVATMDAAPNNGNLLIEGYWQAAWMVRAGDIDRARHYYQLAADSYGQLNGPEADLAPELVQLAQEIEHAQRAQNNNLSPSGNEGSKDP